MVCVIFHITKNKMAEENNFKYLIKSKNYSDCYLQNDSFGASYSSDVGTAIFDKLPRGYKVGENHDDEVIRSDNPKFKEILRKELYGYSNVYGLEGQINNLEYQLKNLKENRNLIVGALNFLERGNGEKK